MNRIRTVLAIGLFCCGVAASATAQPKPPDTGLHSVGNITGVQGVSSNFHGTMPSNGMASNSSQMPVRSGGVNYAPLAPNAANSPFSGGLGGVGGSYRVYGSASGVQPVGPAPVSRYGPSSIGNRVGAGDITPDGLDSGASNNPGIIPSGLSPNANVSPDLGPTFNSGGSAGSAPLVSPLAGLDRVGVAGGRTQMYHPFDLPSQLKANPFWQRGVDMLKAGQFDKAVSEIRLGLVFSPGRSEGEWLMAVAQAAAGDCGDAVARLRNAMQVDPSLLGGPHGAANVLGAELADRLIGQAERAVNQPRDARPADTSAERVLVGAWLAAELGQPARAAVLLKSVSNSAGAATFVAAAMRAATGGPGPEARTANAASSASPADAVRPPSNPSVSLEQWLASEQGQSTGLPPTPRRFAQGWLQNGP